MPFIPDKQTNPASSFVPDNVQATSSFIPDKPTPSFVADIDTPIAFSGAGQPIVNQEPSLRQPTTGERYRFDAQDVSPTLQREIESTPTTEDYVGAVPILGPTAIKAKRVVETGGRSGRANEELFMDLAALYVGGKVGKTVTTGIKGVVKKVAREKLGKLGGMARKLQTPYEIKGFKIKRVLTPEEQRIVSSMSDSASRWGPEEAKGLGEELSKAINNKSTRMDIDNVAKNVIKNKGIAGRLEKGQMIDRDYATLRGLSDGGHIKGKGVPSTPITQTVSQKATKTPATELESMGIDTKQINIVGQPKVPTSQVKPLVREVTGQRNLGKMVPENYALKEAIRHEARGAMAGKRYGVELEKTTERIKKTPKGQFAIDEKRQVEQLVKTAKQAKTLEEKKSILNQARELKKQGRERLVASKKMEDDNFTLAKTVVLDTLAKQPDKYVTSPGAKEDISTLKKFGKGVLAETLTAERIFDKFDGYQNNQGPLNSYFTRNANISYDQELQNIKKRTDTMINNTKELDIKESDFDKTIEVGGRKFTIDEAISIYQGLQNVDNASALIYGNKYSEETLNSVVKALPEKYKQFGDILIEDYLDRQPEDRAAIYEYSNGEKDLGYVPRYSPMRIRGEESVFHADEVQKELELRSQKRSEYVGKPWEIARKNLKEKARPIKLGAYKIWLAETNRREHFNTHATMVKEFQRIVKDRDFSDAIIKKHGASYLKSVRDWVDRVANPSTYKARNMIGTATNVLMEHAAITFLAFNLGTMAKQFPSIMLFMPDISPKDILGGLYDFTTKHDDVEATISRLAPQIRDRSIERSMEVLKNNEGGLYRKIVKKIGRKGMKGIYMIDKLVTHSGWYGAFNKYLDDGMTEKDAALKATQLVLRTQPSARPKDIPNIYAQEVLPVLMQFTNQLSKIWNKLAGDVPGDFKKGRYWKAFVTLMTVAAGQYMISSIKKRKIITDPKEIGYETFLNTTATIPLVGPSISSYTQGYDFTSVAGLSPIKTGVDTAKYAVRGEYGKAAGKAFETAAFIAPVPLAPYREYKWWDKMLNPKGSKNLKNIGGISNLQTLK